jgi:hypothetical protein
MVKQRTWEELQKELAETHQEIEELKATRLQELEQKANEIGYTLVPVAGKKSKATGATTKGKLDRDEARKWLETTLGKGPMEKKALQEKYRQQFAGSRLRVDGWKDLLKEDSKGMVTLK